MAKQSTAVVPLAACVVAVALLCCPVCAVKVGDEQFEDAPEGYFYSFAPGRFDVIDPEAGAIVESVAVEDAIWGDVVYIESSDGAIKFLVAGEQTNDQVVVIDTASKSVVGQIDMGDRPVHLYAVYFQAEVWAHSDGLGTFDVLSIDDTSKLLTEEFQAHVAQAGHGKLLFDEDLGNLAFATNVREGGVIQMDLESKEHLDDTVKFFNFTELNDDEAVCPGTHGIAYSKVNRHLYVECTGSAGIFEFSIDDSRVVETFPQALNQPFTTPDEGFIIVVNKKNNSGHILMPGATGEASTEEFTFTIPGNPDKPAFFPKGPRADDSGLQDYYAFFSLVEDNTTTGMAWVDLEEVVTSDRDVRANVIPVGKVGGSHRSIKRGGKWIATHVHSPQEALAIIDAENKELVHMVEGVGAGARVTYIPKA